MNRPRVSSAAMARPPAIDSLTGLRFWLALWVVLGHVPAVIHAPWLTNLYSHGYLAVSGFFCLSGFILAYNYHSRLDTPADRRAFLAARIARIYPVYLLGLLAWTPAVLFAVRQGTASLRGAAVSFAASAALLQAWDPVGVLSVPWNPPGWSLSAELFFYLSLPLYAAALARRSSRALVALLVAALVLSASLDLGAAFGTSPATLILLRSNPALRVWEFVAGYLGGLLFIRHGSGSLRTATGLAVVGGLVLAAGGVLLPSDQRDFALLAPAFLVLVYGLTHPAGPWHALLASRASRFLGEASYSLYILHLPISLFVYQGLGKRLLPALYEAHPVAWFVGYLATAVAISSAVFVWLERPLRKRLAAALTAWFGTLSFRARSRPQPSPQSPS
jgi:peptidoglycan/LPS O-acetylase OafA/YrhL